ncbi:selenocysteine lyase [Candidatus Methanoperedens nitroreducens]|uniref:cysteine desulfurase n=1 Tax=Candidatus Methanoperedens nitratireducens TaxID=1392998 RepID=A0A062V4I8_9EURY|nr:cysteine desulfurase [Candidatus Methanoperedens nitroreducens]KCZ70739.1 selenocysteine lyase [Candidatus Methanoperedens nitroreducens]MDJ1420596.1 cysteine desulfurase [Candidatus Methanoperedens sp.]
MDIQKIRLDFPALTKKWNGRYPIYFDNACMSLKPGQVIDAMNEYYNEYPVCGGRSLHKMAKKVDEKVSESREKFQRFLGAKRPEEIIFTRNSTEGLNLVANSKDFKRGDIVLTTDREHNSNLVPWQVQVHKRGIKHMVVYSNPDNTFDLTGFEETLNKNRNVRLVSMVHTSNLDGYTIPAKEIIRIAHDHGALVMLDGAQSAPHRPVDVGALDVDFFALSVHKMLGPTGMGVLYGKYHLLEEMAPFIVGGDTVSETTFETARLLPPPEKFEAGLQNYAGIIGSGAAVDYLEKIGRSNIERHEERLSRIITDGIKDLLGLRIIGPQDPGQRSGITTFTVEFPKGGDAHDIAIILDETENIAVRSGAFCVHSWFNYRKYEAAVRASLYLYNSEEEARKFIDALGKTVSLFNS